MSAKDLATLAARIFLASGGGAGPIAIKINRRGRGRLGLTTVDCLRHPSQYAAPGTFFCVVDRLDIFEGDTFIDFGDENGLIGFVRSLASEGLRRCNEHKAEQGRATPVDDDLLQLAVDLAVWLIVLDRKAIPEPVEVLEHLARLAAVNRGDFDVSGAFHASVFSRLSTVPPDMRRLGGVKDLFERSIYPLSEASRLWREGFMEEHRQANEAMREVEGKLNALHQTMATLEGGSYNENYAYFQGQKTTLNDKLKTLRAAEDKAQRAAMLAMGEAAGKERQRLYGASAQEASAPPPDAPVPPAA